MEFGPWRAGHSNGGFVCGPARGASGPRPTRRARWAGASFPHSGDAGGNGGAAGQWRATATAIRASFGTGSGEGRPKRSAGCLLHPARRIPQLLALILTWAASSASSIRRTRRQSFMTAGRCRVTSVSNADSASSRARTRNHSISCSSSRIGVAFIKRNLSVLGGLACRRLWPVDSYWPLSRRGGLPEASDPARRRAARAVFPLATCEMIEP